MRKFLVTAQFLVESEDDGPDEVLEEGIKIGMQAELHAIDLMTPMMYSEVTNTRIVSVKATKGFDSTSTDGPNRKA